jgi:hypothetical protein
MGTVTVMDDDDAPTVNAVDVTVTEGAMSLTDATAALELGAERLTSSSTTQRSMAPRRADDYRCRVDGHSAATTAVAHLGVVGDTVIEPAERSRSSSPVRSTPPS